MHVDGRAVTSFQSINEVIADIRTVLGAGTISWELARAAFASYAGRLPIEEQSAAWARWRIAQYGGAL